MGNIRNKKLMIAKKETLAAKRKHAKQCALEAKEVVESLVENLIFLIKSFQLNMIYNYDATRIF